MNGKTISDLADMHSESDAALDNRQPVAELGQVPIRNIPIRKVYPSYENNLFYRPVDPEDTEILELAKSIKTHGIQEPLIITRDHWIISGHRRFRAAKIVGLKEVPCIVQNFNKDDDGKKKFMQLLPECNRQRAKTFDEKLREEVASANPEEAYHALMKFREEMVACSLEDSSITIRGRKRRAEISPAKSPFLNAIKTLVESLRNFWPLSDRQIHYGLLNNPPLTHASKLNSRYGNTPQCYKMLTELLTRARLEGQIPMNAISDPTRPVNVWNVFADVQVFQRRELNNLFKGYWRNLMQSQPMHIEIIGEKNTIFPVIRPIAAQYTIPLTIGRGFCSLPPRYAIAERYRRSGKDKLCLLILSDFDPDGEEIAHSVARSLRDDFDIFDIEPIKVALTKQQVADFKLPPGMKAKKKSSNYRKFKERHGDNVFELEALAPEDLQKLLKNAIDSVIAHDAFKHEVDTEKKDAASLANRRRQILSILKESI